MYVQQREFVCMYPMEYNGVRWSKSTYSNINIYIYMRANGGVWLSEGIGWHGLQRALMRQTRVNGFNGWRNTITETSHNGGLKGLSVDMKSR